MIDGFHLFLIRWHQMQVIRMTLQATSYLHQQTGQFISISSPSEISIMIRFFFYLLQNTWISLNSSLHDAWLPCVLLPSPILCKKQSTNKNKEIQGNIWGGGEEYSFRNLPISWKWWVFIMIYCEKHAFANKYQHI